MTIDVICDLDGGVRFLLILASPFVTLLSFLHLCYCSCFNSLNLFAEACHCCEPDTAVGPSIASESGGNGCVGASGQKAGTDAQALENGKLHVLVLRMA
jgi:hypothetical protein